jgi:2-amino-4-hydroxy-6-hydroxymethyldihydropteridine diphosphokinase
MDRALAMVRETVGTIGATSFLYETAPELVTDQPSFLNAVALVETRTDDPYALMSSLQAIEAALGRAPRGERQRYGPRPIDLDIVCFGDGSTAIEDGDVLTVPHRLARRRTFVLRPLMDIDPDLVLPATHDCPRATVVRDLWEEAVRDLVEAHGGRPDGAARLLPQRVAPLGRYGTMRMDDPLVGATDGTSPRTAIMAIVNATPDSFSGDGHSAPRRGVDGSVADHIASAVDEGAAIIDIGGYSTRPGHSDVPVDAEIQRLSDALGPILAREDRDRNSGYHVGTEKDTERELLLSIDTFRPEVARSCLDRVAQNGESGVVVAYVNDVMGLRCDPGAMVDVLLGHPGVGIVITHSLGTLRSNVRDPAAADAVWKTEADAESGSSSPRTGGDDDGDNHIVGRVGAALLAAARWIEGRGVPRWRVALDPGIGFGKSPAENALLAGGAARLRRLTSGYPLLIGASRKGFLARAVARRGTAPADVDFMQREIASHAVTAVAAWEGAHMVRVHDVRATRAVIDAVSVMRGGPFP